MKIAFYFGEEHQPECKQPGEDHAHHRILFYATIRFNETGQ
jgi:hypothetical protein